LVGITLRGVRFDRQKAIALRDDMNSREKELLKRIRETAKTPVDIWAAASIARGFDNLGIAYPKTEAGAPSFTKSFLEGCEHPIAKDIIEARELNKTYGTFLQPYIDLSSVDGRIHPHVNQLRSDEGGTVTGRLSMANPNLQQVPARHEVIGPLVRDLFLPEEGQLWASCDYSSQEPRLLIHYAALLNLPGSDRLCEAYRNDPRTDFHQMVADMAGIKRKAAKTIGLGLMYGMGKKKLAQSLDMGPEETDAVISLFHQNVPFLRSTVDAVMRRIENPSSGGAIRTLLGRKCRFPLFEPVAWGVNKALPYEQALIEYGPRIKRAMTYKGLNRLIQGSAADQTKMAMVQLHRAGFKILLQLHDEIVVSVNSREEAEEVGRIMRTAVELGVPSVVDVEVGNSWGSAK
jgi:DNA polymerase I-like protein with 3'-5' exonuclease and polymerase domains